MKKPETKLKEAVQRRLNKIRRPIWQEKIQQVTIRGTPDIIGCSPCDLCGRGLMFALELKDEKGTLDPLQAFKLKQIENAGGCGLVVKGSYDLSVLEDYLSRLPSELTEPTLKYLTEYLIEQTIKAKEKKR